MGKRREPVAGQGVCVLGDRIRFARKELGFSMESVEGSGGPVKGYQSEVERGIKSDVSGPVLAAWMRILGINRPFATGEIGRFDDDPELDRGLAKEVGDWVLLQIYTPAWQNLSSAERQVLVLKRVAFRSRMFTLVALAYYLRLTVAALEAMLSGTLLIPELQLRALANVTGIPQTVLMGANPDEAVLNAYLAPVMLASQRGFSPERLERIVKEAE